MDRDADRVRVRRVYEERRRGDGRRVLVDRLWPRGLRRDEAAMDEWCREVAPSAELRKWYGHDPARFTEFRRLYRAELRRGDAAEAVASLRRRAERRNLTLLTATRDLDISGAAVLAEVLGGPGD